MKVENTPMWTGWNSKIVENKHPMQVVQYLPQIDASPTIVAVVVLTMEMALRNTYGTRNHHNYARWGTKYT